MTAYMTNSKYMFTDLDLAIAKAKEILHEWAYPYSINNDFTVTQGKHGGYCVKSNDDWWKFGNRNATRISIRTIEISA